MGATIEENLDSMTVEELRAIAKAETVKAERLEAAETELNAILLRLDEIPEGAVRDQLGKIAARLLLVVFDLSPSTQLPGNYVKSGGGAVTVVPVVDSDR